MDKIKCSRCGISIPDQPEDATPDMLLCNRCNQIQELEEEISSLENFPLTETQQRLVNYLRANTDDVAEAIGLFE